MAEKRYYRVVAFVPAGDYYNVLAPVFWGAAGFHGQWSHGTNRGDFPSLPPGFVFAHLNLKSADGKRRRNFPLDDPGAVGFPWLGQTITLPNMDGTTTVWTVVGYNSQNWQPRRYRQKKR